MRSSKSRSRSKSNRNRSVGNIVNRVFDSSGPEGKVRGTPQQIIEKYGQLARDAQLSNDRVATENFQQHAEHYVRMLGEAQREAEARREQQEQQQRDRQQADQQRNANNPNNSNNNGQNPQNGGGNGGQQDQQPRSQNRGDQRSNPQPEASQPPVTAPQLDLQDAPQPDVPEVTSPDVVEIEGDNSSTLVETPENSEPPVAEDAAPKPRKRAPRKPRAPKAPAKPKAKKEKADPEAAAPEKAAPDTPAPADPKEAAE